MITIVVRPTLFAVGLAVCCNVMGCARSLPPSAVQQAPVTSPPPKSRLTPAQQKMDSHLFVAAQMARGVSNGATDPSLSNAVKMLELDERGNVHVDMQATVNDALLAEITALGGTVESLFPNYRAIRAWIPLLSVETLAGRTDVAFIKPAEKAILNSPVPTGSTTTGSKAASAKP